MTLAESNPSVAVVICAYTDQRWDETLQAVASVQAQHPPPAELIVVVDHNPDLQARLTAELPGVRVVANQNERGLSGARNTGVDLSTAEIVAFLEQPRYEHGAHIAPATDYGHLFESLGLLGHRCCHGRSPSWS